MEVWDAIRKKRAVRQFKAEPLKDEEMQRILDAGRRSQSSKNGQPWQFVAVTEPELLAQIAATSPNLSHVHGAALCVLMLVPVENERTIFHFFDIGQSASYMQLAALEQGIGSCLGTIYEPDTVRDLLGFPADWQARLLISFGYPLSQDKPAPRPGRPGGRRDFDDVVHWNGW